MAQLDVQPKKSSPWWLWLLIAIVAIIIIIFLLKGCNNKNNNQAATTDSTATKSDTGTNQDGKQVAITQPNWSSVDFNSPASSDQDVTDKDITVRGGDKYTIYTIGENILFATDQPTLQGNAETKLKQISTSLNKRFKDAAIGIFGNTDSTGSAGNNKQLGAQRAAAVKDWLVKTGGIDSTKVSVHSYGETKPVASNATAGGRQQNRNVEIVAFPDSAGH